jgi:hypothetical protein
MKTQKKWLIVVGLGVLGLFAVANADSIGGGVSPKRSTTPKPPQVIIIKNLP